MKKTLSLTIVAATLVLAGCGTTSRPGTYECELHENLGKCASVESAYSASQKVTGKNLGDAQSVFEVRQQGSAQQAQTNGVPVVGQPSGYPEVGEQGMPVFKQPKVLRVWVAPYVDADGNLRSGEYTYFATPGQWNYGDLKKPGAAANSGMFGPARPDALGIVKEAPKAAPKAAPKPSEVATPAANTAPAAQSAAPTAQQQAPAATNNITQPYQRLGGN